MEIIYCVFDEIDNEIIECYENKNQAEYVQKEIRKSFLHFGIKRFRIEKVNLIKDWIK